MLTTDNLSNGQKCFVLILEKKKTTATQVVELRLDRSLAPLRGDCEFADGEAESACCVPSWCLRSDVTSQKPLLLDSPGRPRAFPLIASGQDTKAPNWSSVLPFFQLASTVSTDLPEKE